MHGARHLLPSGGHAPRPGTTGSGAAVSPQLPSSSSAAGTLAAVTAAALARRIDTLPWAPPIPPRDACLHVAFGPDGTRFRQHPRWDPAAYTDDEYQAVFVAFVAGDVTGAVSWMRHHAPVVDAPCELVRFQVSVSQTRLAELGWFDPAAARADAALVGVLDGRAWLLDGYHRDVLAGWAGAPLPAKVVDLGEPARRAALEARRAGR